MPRIATPPIQRSVTPWKMAPIAAGGLFETVQAFCIGNGAAAGDPVGFAESCSSCTAFAWGLTLIWLLGAAGLHADEQTPEAQALQRQCGIWRQASSWHFLL